METREEVKGRSASSEQSTKTNSGFADEKHIPLKKRKTARMIVETNHSSGNDEVVTEDTSESTTSPMRALTPTKAKAMTNKKKSKTDKSPGQSSKLKTFVCEICGYSSNHNWILKRHQMTHSGEKPYSCEICKKTFRQSAHVVGHMRTHAGEKNWRCDICGELFKRSDSLAKHRQTHGADDGAEDDDDDDDDESESKS